MRTVGRGKVKHPLQLSINGQELTGQESALTEEALEARFDTSLLPKTLVFTQEDLLGLLQVGFSGCDVLGRMGKRGV